VSSAGVRSQVIQLAATIQLSRKEHPDFYREIFLMMIQRAVNEQVTSMMLENYHFVPQGQ
jgi:hypothetical protein